MYLQTSITVVLTAISSLVIASPTTSLDTRGASGINCEGSSDCEFGTQNTLGQLIEVISKTKTDTCVGPGKQIACVDGGITDFCAFTQKYRHQDICVSDVKILLNHLKEHGCKNCGSVPVGYPRFKDLDGGMLTVNAVKGGGCRSGHDDENNETGLCPGVK